MARGGARVGAGRKKGTANRKPRILAPLVAEPLRTVGYLPPEETVVLDVGLRPVVPQTPRTVRVAPADEPTPAADALANTTKPGDPTQSATGNDPLEYMLAVIRDPYADRDRKDRLAIAAAPFMHAKVGDSGKKEAKAGAAKQASRGRFAPSPPPKAAR